MRLIQLFGLLVAISAAGQSATPGNIDEESDMTVEAASFSFLAPESYRLADDEQERTLREIRESEFNLDQLAEDDRVLVTEALSKSGIEVQSACKVQKETTTKIRAMLRKWDETSQTQYVPPESDQPARFRVLHSEGSPHIAETDDFVPFDGDVADYPYPLSEANAVIKLVPVDLSSIRRTGGDDQVATFSARPSKLLYANLKESDRLFDLADVQVDFEVDRSRKRLNWLEANLQNSVKVYHFVRIADFHLRYEFEDDPDVQRNVVKSVDHMMKGRMALVFRPHFRTWNTFTYDECGDAPLAESYLFRSMREIANL